MTYKTELNSYIVTLDDTAGNLGTLSAKLGDMGTKLRIAGNVVKAVDKVGEYAHSARNAIDAQLTMLKLTKLAEPLKPSSKALEKVLEKVKPVVDTIDDSIAKLNGKKDGSGSGDDAKGEFLVKLSTELGRAGRALNTASDELEQQALDLDATRQSMLEFRDALDHANFAEFDNLKTEVEAQIQGRNLVTAPLAAAFNDVTGKINNVLGIISDAEFELAAKDIGNFGEIAGLLDKIGGPMEAAAAALKPVEGLLDSVGALVDLVLGPIFDFLTEKLGIDRLFDKVADELGALLPDADFLEPMVAEVQALLDSVRDFNATSFGIDALQLDIDARLYGATVGNALLGPTGIGDDRSETLNGDSGDDILDARGGNDTVNGGAGNDIIIAGGGNDRVFGGAGTDMVYFGGYFNEYELAKNTAGKIVVTHVRPAPGTQNEGSTVLDSIEQVVWRNISFTGAELENAIIGGSVLNGTSGDDLMFLNSTGTPNGDGQHVANGLDGNDRIFGSTANDELNGGTGNDVLIPGFGDDEANGGTGSDTYQVLEGGFNSGFRIDLEVGTVYGYEGRDTLNSVENLVIQGNGDHLLAGSSADNNLLTAGGDDVVSGRGGDDFFNTGEGKDFIIAGAGRDRVQSGDHNDLIFAASLTVAGEDEVFDGGRGTDTLAYTRNMNAIRDFWVIESNMRNEINARMGELNGGTGSVRINAATGLIEKLGATGTVVSTDTAVNIEVFMGSDNDDVLTGAEQTIDRRVVLHGANGNDTLYSNGAAEVWGGDGDDRMVVTKTADSGPGGIFNGGAGNDVLDLTAYTDVRWWADLKGSSSRSVRAYDGDYVGYMRNSGSSIGSINVEGVNEFLFADGAHLIDNDPLTGSIRRIFRTGDGDDELYNNSGFAEFDAGKGDDFARLVSDAKVLGGLGDDRMVFDNTGTENEAWGGRGNDWVTLMQFRYDGPVNGGKGIDTLVFDTRDFAVDVDLKLKTATGIGVNSRIDAQIKAFERVIGSEFSDVIDGAKADETLIGRAGNDRITGRGGDDQLYGGAGNDTLTGNDGDDRLHGGAGNDILSGGKGRDTAVYTYAAPDGLDGEQAAGNFGGVSVNLLSGVATGSFGNDTLSGIENIAGSAGNDSLTGDNGRNVLMGGAGNDILSGLGGRDVLILGTGTDTASGGEGNDRIIVGAGTKTVDGGNGRDRMEFGTEAGQITLDFQTGSYTGTLNVARAVWLDTGTTEARLYNGKTMSPQQVKETQAIYSDDSSDLVRALPPAGDPLAENFRIIDKPTPLLAQGTFTGIETVVGGNASMTILLGTGYDSYDGTRSTRDILDFSAGSGGVAFDIATGVTDSALAIGDNLKGIDGLTGGAGDDTFSGDSANNALRGQGGNDVLSGMDGADVLRGGAGRDTLSGGADGDVLKGGAGRDILRGGGGNDKLSGGAGNDRLKGGTGADSFIFAPGDDTDRVLDFQNDRDLLDLRAFGFADVAAALAKATTFGGDTSFDFGGGDVLVIENISKTDLSDDILV